MTPRTLTAAAALTIAAATGYVETRPTQFIVTTPTDDEMESIRFHDGGWTCVIPDCRNRLLPSGWDESHAPVDCLASGPYAGDRAPVWRGCSVFRAEYAVGSQCLPARCVVSAGTNPLEKVP